MTTIGDDLFARSPPPDHEPMGNSACILRGFALPYVTTILAAVGDLEHQARFRNMVTPGGFTMSVAMSNFGRLGWTTDRRGYRYTEHDPETGLPWPGMPERLLELASSAARRVGFDNFVPDACLVNRYVPGSRLSLHQDRNEADFDAPIVSVSLGMPAVFLFGGHERHERPRRFALLHGDVAVWGGVDRLRYHGVMPLKDSPHHEIGAQRLNLTFRRAG
jgi:alkylated DNA repair protein (DNA oxidative demethylase)